MMAHLKSGLAVAAIVLLPASPVQADEVDMQFAKELGALKAALQQVEQVANEDARYVLPLRTNFQLARLSAQCAGYGDDQEKKHAICESTTATVDSASVENEPLAF